MFNKFEDKIRMQEKYRKLVHAIHTKGTKYPKEYGSWISLKIGENEFLCMDSWNSSITHMSDAVYNNHCTGFKGNCIAYLGIDWGGFECHVNENYLDELLDKIEKL